MHSFQYPPLQGSHIFHSDFMLLFVGSLVFFRRQEKKKKNCDEQIPEYTTDEKEEKECISCSRLHSHPLIQLSFMYALWLINYKASRVLLQLFHSFLSPLFILHMALSRKNRSGSRKAILFRQ